MVLVYEILMSLQLGNLRNERGGEERKDKGFRLIALLADVLVHNLGIVNGFQDRDDFRVVDLIVNIVVFRRVNRDDIGFHDQLGVDDHAYDLAEIGLSYDRRNVLVDGGHNGVLLRHGDVLVVGDVIQDRLVDGGRDELGVVVGEDTILVHCLDLVQVVTSRDQSCLVDPGWHWDLVTEMGILSTAATRECKN